MSVLNTNRQLDMLMNDDKILPAKMEKLEKMRVEEDLKMQPRAGGNGDSSSDSSSDESSEASFGEQSVAIPSTRTATAPLRSDRLTARNTVRNSRSVRPDAIRGGYVPQAAGRPALPLMGGLGPRRIPQPGAIPRQTPGILADRLVANPAAAAAQPQSSRAMGRDYYYRLTKLKKKHGVVLTRPYTVDSDPLEMKEEYEFHIRTRKRENTHEYFLGGLVYGTMGIEMANKKYNPFALKLDGWSASISENRDNYDDVIDELVEKWTKPSVDGKGGGIWGGLPAEVRLVLMVLGSGLAYHFTSVFLGHSGAESTVRENKDLAVRALEGLDGGSGSGETGPSEESVLNMIRGSAPPAQSTWDGEPVKIGKTKTIWEKPTRPSPPSFHYDSPVGEGKSDTRLSPTDIFKKAMGHSGRSREEEPLVVPENRELEELRQKRLAKFQEASPPREKDLTPSFFDLAPEGEEEDVQDLSTSQASASQSPLISPSRNALATALGDIDEMDWGDLANSIENTDFPQQFSDSSVDASPRGASETSLSSKESNPSPSAPSKREARLSPSAPAPALPVTTTKKGRRSPTGAASTVKLPSSGAKKSSLGTSSLSARRKGVIRL